MSDPVALIAFAVLVLAIVGLVEALAWVFDKDD
jgi:hypothetical protein